MYTPQEYYGCGRPCVFVRALHPQGIDDWLLLRSPQGEPVGAVHVSLCLVSVAGQALDTRPSARAPLAQAPALLALLPPGAPLPCLPTQFRGQWARCTVLIEDVRMDSVPASVEAKPGAYKYFITYTLPGSSSAGHASTTTAAAAGVIHRGGSAVVGREAAAGAAAAAAAGGWVVPLRHCGVHWVRADASLAAALARRPLVGQLWRVRERASVVGGRGHGGAGAGAGPGGAGLSTVGGDAAVSLGHVSIDLTSLVQQERQGGSSNSRPSSLTSL